jgi:MFS family permease
MSWWTTIFIALLTGLFGLVCAGMAASICTKWYSISDAAGRGYFVVYTAFFGGLASGIVGIVVSRIVGGWDHPGFFKGLGCSWLAVAAISIVAVLLSRWQAHVPPKIAGQNLVLEIEMRLPAADSLPPAKRDGSASFRLGSVTRHVQRQSRSGEVHLDKVRQEEGRWIIPASVFLFTGRGLRSIDMELGGRSVGGFIVPLPGRPRAKHGEWSGWGPRGTRLRPWPETKTSYRFRVTGVVPKTESA